MRNFLQEAVCNEITWDISCRKLSVMRLHETFHAGSCNEITWDISCRRLYETTWDISCRKLSVMRLHETFSAGAVSVMRLHETFFVKSYLYIGKPICNEIVWKPFCHMKSSLKKYMALCTHWPLQDSGQTLNLTLIFKVNFQGHSFAKAIKCKGWVMEFNDICPSKW